MHSSHMSPIISVVDAKDTHGRFQPFPFDNVFVHIDVCL